MLKHDGIKRVSVGLGAVGAFIGIIQWNEHPIEMTVAVLGASIALILLPFMTRQGTKQPGEQ